MRSLLCLFPWKVYIFQLLDHSPVQVNLLLSDFRLPTGVCLQGHSWNPATFYFQHAAISWKEMIILFKWLRWVWPRRALLQIRSLQLVVHLKDAKWMWDFFFSETSCCSLNSCEVSKRQHNDQKSKDLWRRRSRRARMSSILWYLVERWPTKGIHGETDC